MISVQKVTVRIASNASVTPSNISKEIDAVVKPQVVLSLAMTVLGFGGVFAVYTFIQPPLTQVTGLADSKVSGALLLFGGGMAMGNVVGGKLADRNAMSALLMTLTLLAMVLLAMPLAFQQAWPAMGFVALLGFAAFATVAPLQMRVLEKTAGAGKNLASSLNIAAFNIGNALGAWLGGMTLDHGPGLRALGAVGAVMPVAALLLAFASRRLDARGVAFVATPE